MALDRTWYNALADDDGSGLTGTPWNKAAVDALMDAVDVRDAALTAAIAAEAARIGPWVAVPYVAGNFTAGGAMTWTVDAGDVVINRYIRIGKLIVWNVQIAASTIAGTPSTLLGIAAPAGVSFANLSDFSPLVLPQAAYAVPLNAGQLGLAMAAGGNWTAGVNSVYVYFTFVGETT